LDAIQNEVRKYNRRLFTYITYKHKVWTHWTLHSELECEGHWSNLMIGWMQIWEKAHFFKIQLLLFFFGGGEKVIPPLLYKILLPTKDFKFQQTDMCKAQSYIYYVYVISKLCLSNSSKSGVHTRRCFTWLNVIIDLDSSSGWIDTISC
jgi:hypothetical protein